MCSIGLLGSIHRLGIKVRTAISLAKDQIHSDPNKRLSEAKLEVKESLDDILAASLNTQQVSRILLYAKGLPSFVGFDKPGWNECVVPEVLQKTRRRTPFLLWDSLDSEPGSSVLLVVSYTIACHCHYSV